VRRVPGHGLPAHDATSEPDGARRHEAIGLRRKVVRRNAWRLADVRRLDMHAPTALRPYVADGCREGGKAVERITELVQRERLDVVLEIRRLDVVRRIGEGPELAGRHGHRPALRAEVLQAHPRPTP